MPTGLDRIRERFSWLSPAARQWLLAFIFLFHWVVPLYRAVAVEFTVWRVGMVIIGFGLMMRAILRARKHGTVAAVPNSGPVPPVAAGKADPAP